MRTIIIACVLAGCASGPSFPRVECGSIRHMIDDTIQHEPGTRELASMGRVSEDRAIVYTRTADGAHDKELWKRTDGRWQLAAAAPMSAPPPPDVAACALPASAGRT